MIYKIMPRVSVQWRDVWLGAVVTALLFTVGRFLIGLYIGKSGVASGFGAAGSLIIVFVWVYYSAQIFLIGAEFTWIYATKFGSMRHLSGQPVVKAVEEIPSALPSADAAVLPALIPAAAHGSSSGLRVRSAVAGFGMGLLAGLAASLAWPRRETRL